MSLINLLGGRYLVHFSSQVKIGIIFIKQKSSPCCMDLKAVISKLHPLERKVIPVLITNRELGAISIASGLDLTETMRALQWLENKEALTLESKMYKVVSLDSNGLIYLKAGVPEQRLFDVLSSEFQSLSVVAAKSKLSVEEVTASLGILMRERVCESRKEAELMLRKAPGAQTFVSTVSAFLAKPFPINITFLSSAELDIVEALKKRKSFIRVEEKKIVTVVLTALGEALTKEEINSDVVNRLTPAMLKSGSWQDKEFRAYDIEMGVPSISGARVHFTNQAIDYIKNIWVEMGFREMTGNYVQSAFWDLDALFVPQDHPAREMQDTFYLPGKARLSAPLFSVVKEVHETGGKTGSLGWRYPFSKAESEQILLRTHTTVLSAQTIAGLKKEQLPAKFFAVGKVFRNEALDWKHLFEFDQVEGIVIDPDATLAHLKGYLQEFYSKMGYSQIRMRPAHFPYTEPSLEIDVFHPIRKEWVELGGAGIFRPEVVRSLLGFDCTVLAWGQGMGRIISEYWKITDIRVMYTNDLAMIRKAKVYLK